MVTGVHAIGKHGAHFEADLGVGTQPHTRTQGGGRCARRREQRVPIRKAPNELGSVIMKNKREKTRSRDQLEMLINEAFSHFHIHSNAAGEMERN